MGAGTLVHNGLLAVGSPHSSASRPPSPQGKAWGDTIHHKKCSTANLYRVDRAFPEGEGGPAQAGSDEGHLPQSLRIGKSYSPNEVELLHDLRSIRPAERHLIAGQGKEIERFDRHHTVLLDIFHGDLRRKKREIHKALLQRHRLLPHLRGEAQL